MDQSEQNIIQLIRNGDKEVFRILFDVYYKRLLVYARSYSNENGEAEDIVQDLFFSLWEKRNELVILTSLSSYLFRAVHNRCIQHLRHKKVVEGFEITQRLRLKEAEVLYQSASDYSFTELHFKEIQNILDKTSSKLPSKTHEIFRLSRESSKTYKEIAEALNIEVKTVEYHISKALKVYYAALKDYMIR
jgi:RNA polymerase sigma-70 factor (family 1)